jgi:hypothetical protein
MYGELAVSSFAGYADRSQFTAEVASALRLRREKFGVPGDMAEAHPRI